MSKLVEPILPLQELDLQYHRVKEDRDEKPRLLTEFQQKKDRASGNVQAIAEEIKQFKLDASKREKEIKELDEKIEKCLIQSNQARKNEEYQALLKEISGLKADRGRIEDGLLDIYMQLDEKGKLQKIRQEELAAAEKEYQEAKTRIEGEMAGLDKQLEALLDQRRQRAEGVSNDVLKAYERILRAKEDGLAIAHVETNIIVGDKGKETQYTCAGCSVSVNSQDVNLCLLGREIVVCRYCSRILYVKKDEE